MYKIIGADGRQYGPIDADQLRRWIVEGRANALTHVLVDGALEWKPLGTLPEFAAHFAPSTPPPLSPLAPQSLRRTNAFAVWGMIFGIFTVVCCCCCANTIFGVLGLIFSIVGLSQINERPDIYEGRGFAIVGLVLSVLGLALALFVLVGMGLQHPYMYHWYNRRYY